MKRVSSPRSAQTQKRRPKSRSPPSHRSEILSRRDLRKPRCLIRHLARNTLETAQRTRLSDASRRRARKALEIKRIWILTLLLTSVAQECLPSFQPLQLQQCLLSWSLLPLKRSRSPKSQRRTALKMRVLRQCLLSKQLGWRRRRLRSRLKGTDKRDSESRKRRRSSCNKA